MSYCKNRMKKERKNEKKIATEHNIVLFFGDNLSDFTGFDEKSVKSDKSRSQRDAYSIWIKIYFVPKSDVR